MIHLNQDTFHAIVVRHEGLIRTLKVGDIITSPLQNRWLVHLWNGDKQTLSNIFLNKENKKRMVTKLTRSFFLLSLSWDPEGSKSFKLLIWSLMVSRYLHTQRSVIKIKNGNQQYYTAYYENLLSTKLWLRAEGWIFFGFFSLESELSSQLLEGDEFTLKSRLINGKFFGISKFIIVCCWVDCCGCRAGKLPHSYWCCEFCCDCSWNNCHVKRSWALKCSPLGSSSKLESLLLKG